MLILPFAYHVDQFDTGQERLCPAKRFESQHLLYPTFEILMVLFTRLFRYLLCLIVMASSSGFPALSVTNAAAVTDSLAKETQRGGGIPLGG
jgi:hypothetical protein